MREIVGASAVIDGKARSISGVRVLGRYRLQIRLTKPVGDFTARLTLAFFCPSCRARRPTRGIDNPAGSGPYYVAERVVNQRIVLRTQPLLPRRAGRRTSTGSFGRSRRGKTAWLPSRKTASTTALPASPTRTEAAETYGINRAGGRFFVSPFSVRGSSSSTTTARHFRGPRGIPLEKAINYAIDRHAMAHATGTWRASAPTRCFHPCSGATSTSIPSGAPTGQPRASGSRGRSQTKGARPLRAHRPGVCRGRPGARLRPEAARHRLEVKYFDSASTGEKIVKRGEPFDIAMWGWNADYADAASFLVPLLGSGGSGRPTRPALGRPAHRPPTGSGEPPHRRGAAERLGGPRRRPDARLTLPGLRTFSTPLAPTSSRRSVGCFLFQPVYGLDIAAACKK